MEPGTVIPMVRCEHNPELMAAINGLRAEVERLTQLTGEMREAENVLHTSLNAVIADRDEWQREAIRIQDCLREARNGQA